MQMWQLNKKQIVALSFGFSAILLLLLFPPPGEGQTEWPVFVYSTHQVLNKRQPNGQPVSQYGWESPGLAGRVRLPILMICTLTAVATLLAASPRTPGYPTDPNYRPSFRNPNLPRPRRR